MALFIANLDFPGSANLSSIKNGHELHEFLELSAFFRVIRVIRGGNLDLLNLDSAKIGVLAASLISGIIGSVVLLSTGKEPALVPAAQNK